MRFKIGVNRTLMFQIIFLLVHLRKHVECIRMQKKYFFKKGVFFPIENFLVLYKNITEILNCLLTFPSREKCRETSFLKNRIAKVGFKPRPYQPNHVNPI